MDSQVEDCHLRRVLWRDMDTSREPDVYLTMLVSFGDGPAGVVAMTAARLSCEGYETLYPQAVELITKDSYVDDLLHSGKSLQDLTKIVKEADLILNSHGFNVKKWIYSGEDVTLKVLGVHWSAGDDSLVLRPTFSLVSKNKKSEQVISHNTWNNLPSTCTKRQLFSLIMSLYDPLGFMAPLIVQLKLVMREIAGNDIGWDDDIPVQCWEKFKTAMFELLKLVDFKIPRAVCNSEFPDTPNADLVIFTDASSVAMVAGIHLWCRLKQRMPLNHNQQCPKWSC